jgi:hypothetical protein
MSTRYDWLSAWSYRLNSLETDSGKEGTRDIGRYDRARPMQQLRGGLDAEALRVMRQEREGAGDAWIEAGRRGCVGPQQEKQRQQLQARATHTSQCAGDGIAREHVQ